MTVPTARPALLARLREAASHTVIYGLGSVLQTALGFILIPVYTQYFTPELYGVFSLLTLAGTVAGSVFFLGASSALSRSYYDYADPAERRVVVTTSLAITAAGAAAQVVVGIAFARPIALALFGDARYAVHVAVALAAAAVTFVNGLLYVVLRFERRSALVVVMNAATLVLATAVIVTLLAVARLGVMAPILGGLVTQAIALVALLVACRRALAPAISRVEIPIQLRFGLMAVATGLGYYVLDSVDRVFIARLCTMSDVGVYSLGYKIGMIIHIVFIMPFAQIWAPMRMEYRDDPTSADLFRLVLTYYWMIGVLATVALSLFSREIIAVVARRPDYVAAYRVVPFVMFAHLFYGVLNIVDFGLFVSRKVQYHVALFWGVLVLNLAANYALIGRFGYMAAAWTTLGSYVVLAAAMFVAANRFYAFPVEWRRVGLVVASGAAVMVGGSWLSTTISVQTVALKLVLFALLGVFWYIAVMSDAERKRLRPAALVAAVART